MVDTKDKGQRNKDKAYKNKHQNKIVRFIKINQELIVNAEYNNDNSDLDDDLIYVEDWFYVFLMAVEDNEVTLHLSITLNDV